MLVGFAIAIALVLSGLALRKRQRRNLTFVVACIICINVPFGTLLGVFTLIVLSRASVKALYDQRAYETAP
jgi:heme A synthase